MSIALADRGCRALLLDVEGTTTPLGFVHDVLFPYARARLRDYLRARRETPDVAEISARLAAEHAEDVARGANPPPWASGLGDAVLEAIEAYAGWLMNQDRKSPALKLLQGQIWNRGYVTGELRGELFPDVAPAMRRWRDAGLHVAIYSSGSELAQRRLFESTAAGDLTPLITAFFDTRVGAKVAPASYERIAAALDLEPDTVLFVSDAIPEIDAARQAGLAAALAVRPGNPPHAETGYELIRTFDELA